MNFLKINPLYIRPENADTVVEELKHAYDKNVAKVSTDSNDETYFSWKNHNMTICVCKVSYNSGPYSMVFAVSSKKDKLKIFDLIKETDNYDFYSLFGKAKQSLSYLLLKNLISEVNANLIIATSMSPISTSWNSFINTWVSNEYKHASKHFSKTPIEIFNFNNLGLHAAKYKFDVMINTINNDQFSIELSERLYAYEHEKYYLCAAGMGGGILESILYFSLENYKLIDKNIPNNPTALDFIRILQTNDLITKRYENYIKSIFMLRNSVSHHNSGFTDVSQCQTMMLGSRNIFTTIFQPSKAWNKENPDLSYKEYLRNR